MEKTVEKIIQYTKELRLPGIRKQLPSLLENFGKNKQSYVDFLQQLLEIEHTTRVHNRRLSRVRRARFPFKKYLEELNVKELPDSAANLLAELSSLTFITEGRNIILAGNPGTGKNTFSNRFRNQSLSARLYSTLYYCSEVDYTN